MSTVLGRKLDPIELISKPNNSLDNGRFFKKNYPVWTSWNGVYYDGNYINNLGLYKGLANWIHYSSTYNQGFSTYVGNQFLEIDPARPNTTNRMGTIAHSPLNFGSPYQNRIIKIYGVEDYFPTNYPTGARQTQLTRSSTLTGAYPNTYGHPRFVSNTTADPSTTDLNSSSSAMYHYNHWARHEWTNIVSVPDSATSVTFGAWVKIASDDKLKWPNWAGIYCTQDTAINTNFGTATRYVNYFGIKKSNDSFTRPTGTVTGMEANYNWNGVATNVLPSSSGGNVKYLAATTLHITEHEMLDEDDVEEFVRVEYTFDLESGTNRKMGVSIFFAESIGNMRRQNGDLTGGFQVYDVHTEFHT